MILYSDSLNHSDLLNKFYCYTLYLSVQHLSPAQRQEQAAVEPVDSRTPKTASADHGHTEIQTLQERLPVIKAMLLEPK